MTSWQVPLVKLVGLIVLLPFLVAYLHLYYHAYWKNEYCFVGPHVSMVSGKQYEYKEESLISSHVVENGNSNPDNKIRGESTPTSTNKASIQNNEILQLHGIYAPISQNKKRKGQNDIDQRKFQQTYATTPFSNENSSQSFLSWSRGWPSITQSSIMITSPSSQLSNHQHAHNVQQDVNRNSNHVIAFVEENNEKRWCLQSAMSTDADAGKWCSNPLPSYPDETTIYPYPPSGVWKSSLLESDDSTSTSKSSSLYISCQTPTTIYNNPTKSNKKSRHKQQNGKQNKNVQFLLNHPATTFLLLLNTGLAFHYWNHRISPSTVCKQYTKIVIEHEWWRGLTGATAHFEPLHIGFNMMSLHTLGNELEAGYGSIVFLMYNVALVVFTTMVMMAMVYARITWIQRKLDSNRINPQLQSGYQEQQQRLRDTSSVGYSAVLFAWMVVSTMERKQPTCPVPFFSDVCFSTYSVPGVPFLKFNISPIVSLFVAQFIMPRVSFMGHLAGIVCGFCLHWGLVPPLEMCSPNILIGGVFLCGLILRRRVIPVRPLLTAVMDEEGCVEHEEYLISLLADNDISDDGCTSISSVHPPLGQSHGNGITLDVTSDPFVRSKQKKKERELNEIRRKQKTLLFLRNSMGIMTLASLFVFDWRSSLVLSQCILLAYFTCAIHSSFIVWAYTHSKVESDIIEPEKARAGMIWRGFLMSATISIIIDSMSMAGGGLLSTLISAEKNYLTVGLIPVCVFMFLRLSVTLLTLVLSSKILHDMGQVGGGIFSQVFSMVIQWSKLIGDHGVFVSQKPLWTAFEGRGITLGR